MQLKQPSMRKNKVLFELCLIIIVITVSTKCSPLTSGRGKINNSPSVVELKEFFTSNCDSLISFSKEIVNAQPQKLYGTSFLNDSVTYRSLYWHTSEAYSKDIQKGCLDSSILEVIFPRRCVVGLSSSQLISLLIRDPDRAHNFGEVMQRATILDSIQKIDLTISPYLNYIVFTLENNRVREVKFLCAR